MPFGSPRPSVTFTNIGFVVIGGLLMYVQSGIFWWLGLILLLLGLFLGLIMGSWFQLLPGSKPIGKRDDSDST